MVNNSANGGSGKTGSEILDQKKSYSIDQDIPHGEAPMFLRNSFQQIPNYSELNYQKGQGKLLFLFRAAIMAGIFVIGTAIGLRGAWWNEKSGNAAVISGTEISRTDNQNPDLAVNKNANENASTAPRIGINLNELPYDGKPMSKERGLGAEAQYMFQENPPHQKAASAAKGHAAGKGVKQETAVPIFPEKEPKEVDANRNNKGSTRTQNTDGASRTKPVEKKIVKTNRDYRISPQAIKDREIERIRQQAIEELKKKTENQHVGVDRNKSWTGQSARQVNKRSILLRCERMANFFHRERCKWDICGGKWGKYGCPSYSYEKQANSY